MRKFRLAIAVGVFMAFLSLYPQLFFKYSRGENYNGATFYYDFDESAYASYLQALIDGRPRKNSIYQATIEPQTKETLLSIQFAAAYITALPARILGLSSDTTFLIISFVFAFLAGFTIFVFLLQVTENDKFAAVGTLFILLFGANAGGASILKEYFGFGASAFYLTFLRRFTPAVVFPAIFVLFSCLKCGLEAQSSRTKQIYGFATLFCFAYLLFGYFFYWTAILAWIFIFVFLWMLLVKQNRNYQFWGAIFIGIIICLIPYFLLIFDRNPTINSTYVLEATRKIIFLRPSLIVGLLVFLLTLISIKLKRIEKDDQITIFIISLSVLPLFVFNQQIITGRSLQPMHYNMYILNYLVLLAFVLLVERIFKERLNKLRSLFWFIPAVTICIWGLIETDYTTKYRYAYNQRRDEAFLVNKRLAELAKENFEGSKSQITFNLDLVQGDNQPTVAPQGTLWAEHLFLGGNISMEEHQNRYFLYLYFQGYNENGLRNRLQNCPNDSCRALIGWRINPTLSFNSSKVEATEINSLVEQYAGFIKGLTPENVYQPTISFLVIPKGFTTDLTNFEKWYQKESAEQHGNFTLYKVKPLKQ